MHFLGINRLDLLYCLVHRRNESILKRFDIVGIDDFLGELYAYNLLLAVNLYAYRTAAGRYLILLFVELTERPSRSRLQIVCAGA